MMKKLTGKKRWILIGCIAAAAVVAALLIWRHFAGRGDDKSQDVAYVDTVANWTGAGMSAGMYNRFAGVIESQETWSAKQSSDSEIKEVLVEAGDEVKKGDALFTYDMDKFQADLDQAKIDLERMNNDLTSSKETVKQLEAEKKKAKAAEQGNYTLQIKEQELSIKQKELEIKSKELEIGRLEENMKKATVTSEIDGVVQSVNTGDEENMYSQGDGSVVTIMQTGNLRVKGTVNEQNISELTEGAPVIVHSRVDETTWSGTIDKIDLEGNAQSQDAMYSDSETGSSKKPFYVGLESSEGLMLGQHVYMELDFGQGEEKEGLWLDEYLIDRSDESNPFVWADEDGTLKKRSVTLGEYDEELMRYQVTGGLALTDSIASPTPELHEGMRAAPMSEMTFDEEAEGDMGGMETMDGTEEMGIEEGADEMGIEEGMDETGIDEEIPEGDFGEDIVEETPDGPSQGGGMLPVG